jgi:ABC-type phosphate transport system ATPase subunit
MKQSGQEVPFSSDFLGGGHTQEVTIASASVAIVQDSVIFIDGNTSSKDSVDPSSIENIFDEEVSRGLMVNA